MSFKNIILFKGNFFYLQQKCCGYNWKLKFFSLVFNNFLILVPYRYIYFRETSDKLSVHQL